MSVQVRWSANVKFLDQAIAANDRFVFSHHPLRSRPGSSFQREIRYLVSQSMPVQFPIIAYVGQERLMLNPCTQHVSDLFASMGKGTPKLISESRNEESFGSGGTTLELDGLRLHVVNDRAIETVEVGLENVGESLDIHPALNDYKDEMGQPTCPLEFLAVMKGWVLMDEWLRHYQLAGDPVQYDAETPPPGPYYELAEAIRLLKDSAKWNELIAISSNHSLQLEAGSVAESLQREFEARLVRSK